MTGGKPQGAHGAHDLPTWLALLAALTGTPACGDDAGADPPTGAGDAAIEAGPVAVVCGGRRCPESPAGTPSCCTVEGAGVAGHALEITGRAPDLCGTDIGDVVQGLAGLCLQIEQPGEIDPGCPDQVVPPEFAEQSIAPMRGCCSDEGFCGSMEEVFPLGCLYATGRRGKPCGFSTEDDAGGLQGDASDAL